MILANLVDVQSLSIFKMLAKVDILKISELCTVTHFANIIALTIVRCVQKTSFQGLMTVLNLEHFLCWYYQHRWKCLAINQNKLGCYSVQLEICLAKTARVQATLVLLVLYSRRVYTDVPENIYFSDVIFLKFPAIKQL